MTKKISKYIKKYNLSYSYITEETGYARGHISRVLNGHKNNSIQFAKLLKAALQKHLDVQLNWLQEQEEKIKQQQEELLEGIKELEQPSNESYI